MMRLLILFLGAAMLFVGMPLSGGSFSFPVARTVDYAGDAGGAWRESGVMSVSVTAAQAMWELALKRDGWRLLRIIPVSTVGDRQLQIWKKRNQTLMLCLWRRSCGSAGYMWGIIRKGKAIRR